MAERPEQPPGPRLVSWLVVAAGAVLAAGAGVLAAQVFGAAALPFVFPVLFLAAVVLAAAVRDNARGARLLGEVRAQADLLRAANDRLRLLESAVVHAHDAVVVLAAEAAPGAGRSVLYVNDAFSRMTGYSRDEVVGRSLSLLRGPESDPETLGRLRTALNDGRSLRTELCNYRKDGSGYWVDLSLVPARDAAGQLTHWVMIQRDVTKRRAAEDALRRSEAMFRGIFEGAAAGVSLTDATGRFVSCNPAFAAMVGRTVEEVRTLTPADITHPEDYAAQRPLMAEVAAGTRDRFLFPKRYVQPNGEVVWTELSYAAVRGADGRVEYGLGVSVNVTERRKLEQQLRQVQKMEAVGQMAGGIAHDFNNLLTVVMGNLAEVLLPPDDANRPLLEAMGQAAARAADLTRKLLGFARRNQLMPSPVAPADALEEVAGLLRRTLDPRIQVSTAVESGCGPVLADPTLLTQALLNLCLNSRDAMPAGGTLELTAGAFRLAAADPDRCGDARPGPFVRLSVRDTGHGMTDEVKVRIFEPFFTTKGPGKGTGLGLAMVHGIVKQHGGWAECESAPGAGTRIDLYLPATKAEAAAARVVGRGVPGDGPLSAIAPWPAGTKHAARGAEADDSTGRTVLLVDDESMIRDLGRAVLERSGYRVLTAVDGIDAVEVFGREHASVDLVILDVTMPRMSGRDAFRHMVEIEPAARVLFSTGYSAEELAELNGALGLLNKPYRPAELLAAVRDALSTVPAA